MLKLGEYVDKLPEDGKRRYREKTSLVGFDPFALFESQAAAITGAKRWTLPPVDGSDIVSYLVLQTSLSQPNSSRLISRWRLTISLFVAG